MSEIADKISEEVETLKQVRDELRVKIHLGAAEARDRWDELEKNWQHLEGKVKLLRDESREPLQEIGQATRDLLKEIREGYKHLRSLL